MSKFIFSKYIFFLLFMIVMNAQALDATKCGGYIAGISSLQQSQLSLVSESCVSALPYANDKSVSKPNSLCNLANLQREYNALQAESTILYGIKKLNEDAVSGFGNLQKINKEKIAQAKEQAVYLTATVKKINVLRNFLMNEDFMKYIQSGATADVSKNTLDIYCKAPVCQLDQDSYEMMSGFIASYLTKSRMSAYTIVNNNVENDFANYNQTLVNVPSDVSMESMLKHVNTMDDEELTDEDKKAAIENIKNDLVLLKKDNNFQNPSDPFNGKADSMNNVLLMAKLIDQKKPLTTNAIDLLIQEDKPNTASVISAPQAWLSDYSNAFKRNLVSQDGKYAKAYAQSMKDNIDQDIATANGEYVSEGCKDNGTSAACSNISKKLRDLAVASAASAAAPSMVIDQNKLNGDYKKKLKELECIEDEKTVDLEKDQAAIYECLGKKATGDKLNTQIFDNEKKLKAKRDQIAAIYGTDDYKNRDAVKNKGIKTYLLQCSAKETKDVTGDLVKCDSKSETPIKVFMDDTGAIISTLNKDQLANELGGKNSEGYNLRLAKRLNKDAEIACDDVTIAEASGTICAVLNKDKKSLADLKNEANTDETIDYKNENGVVKGYKKKNDSRYYGAGIVNAMGTAVSSYTNYRNTMGVVNSYKQSAAYAAQSEYYQKNMLYWTPSVPQTYSNPYLYTGAPLGVMNPYSTNFQYDNNSYYYNTSYDPLQGTTSNGSGGSNSSFGGFN